MKKIIYTALACSTLLLAGCYNRQAAEESKAGANIPTAPKTVKIGVIAPLSGPAAPLGSDAVKTYEYAAQKFNGSHKDIRLEIVAEDGKCNGKDASSAAQKLATVDRVKVIISTCSSETLAAAKITVPANIVLVSAVASNPDISKETDKVYRYYNDINQADALKSYLDTHSIDKAALIYENTDYGQGFATALTNAVGADRVIVTQKFNTDEKDLSIVAKAVSAKKGQIQGIIYVPNNDNASINTIKSLETEGLLEAFKGKIFTTEAGYSNTTVKELGSRMDGILTSQLPDAEKLGADAATFVTDLKKTYQPQFAEVFTVLYKEAFDMIADGIANEKYGIDNLNSYIKNITKDNPRNGLFGSYYFNGADAERVKFVMKKVEGGKLVSAE